MASGSVHELNRKLPAVASPWMINAGAAYSAACQSGGAIVPLCGLASNDPDNGPLSLAYSWTTDCPGAAFDDPTSPTRAASEAADTEPISPVPASPAPESPARMIHCPDEFNPNWATVDVFVPSRQASNQASADGHRATFRYGDNR